MPVLETHTLKTFAGLSIWVEIDDEGNASLFLFQPDDPEEPISLDGDAINAILDFWKWTSRGS